MSTKTVCDVCGVEIGGNTPLVSVSTVYKNGTRRHEKSVDLCCVCAMKLDQFLKGVEQ